MHNTYHKRISQIRNTNKMTEVPFNHCSTSSGAMSHKNPVPDRDPFHRAIELHQGPLADRLAGDDREKQRRDDRPPGSPGEKSSYLLMITG